MKQPVRIAVTGAAGNISYSLLFKIASGEMLEPRSAGNPATGRDSSSYGQAERRCHGAGRLCIPTDSRHHPARQPIPKVSRVFITPC